MNHRQSELKGVAYFSMEFGLSEALPIYSGGLGILAGDHFKSASDLNVPLVGIGLLYQQGYFRQVLADNGWQLEAFPFNDPELAARHARARPRRPLAAGQAGSARAHAVPPRVAGPGGQSEPVPAG